nr:hypothetical protein [Tanacetum cinerariifolium]
VAILQEQVIGEEKLKAAFKEFKRYEDDRVEQRCAEMEARLDALSIDFDEEIYHHKLTAIAGRRWVIGRGLRLAVMKCGESLELRQAFADVVSAGIAKGIRDPDSENASSPVEVGSPESTYWPEWGVANGSLLDTPEACQDLVDHVAPLA